MRDASQRFFQTDRQNRDSKSPATEKQRKKKYSKVNYFQRKW